MSGFTYYFLISQVMIQPHNRQMSFSLYICALAVSDTIVVLTGKSIHTSVFKNLSQCENGNISVMVSW